MAQEKKCLWCSKSFSPDTRYSKFCSHACAAKSMHASRPVTTKEDISAGVIGADNERYTRDENGQWWFKTTNAPHRTRAFIKTCARCSRLFLSNIFSGKRALCCSRKCGTQFEATQNPDRARGPVPGKFSGDKARTWDGGRHRMQNGYVRVWCPQHPTKVGKSRANTYVFEHRLVMEKHLGRYLGAKEQVHHKNGIRDDNRIENLELWAKQQPSGARANEQQHCATCRCFMHKH